MGRFVQVAVQMFTLLLAASCIIREPIDDLAGAGDATGDLNIYWIDVEGGGATLIVTPSRESVLMDAGWPTEDERDARRIVAAMANAGIDKIDYFIASHFHEDHAGGLPALARRVPIEQYIDYGESDQLDSPKIRTTWEGYLSVAKGARRTVTPGDTLSLDGINFTFITAKRAVIDHALSDSGANTLCEKLSSNNDSKSVNKENESTLTYLLSLGEFDFLDLGDLTVNKQRELACPANMIGVVDLYQVPHHGDGLAPVLTWALAPTVAVVNNGPHKGGGPKGFEVISAIPGLSAIWQVHRALKNDDKHNTSGKMTANLTEENDAGYWIRATVRADGRSYVIENGRNGYSKTYLTK